MSLNRAKETQVEVDALESEYTMTTRMSYWFITSELDQMSKYLNLVQASLQDHHEKLKLVYNKELIGDDPNVPEGAYLLMKEVNDFSQLFLMSFIIAWYSFVEQKLLDLCDQLNLKLSVGPKDDSGFGKGVRRAYKFLLEAKQYTLDKNHWQELLRIGRLRNILVHEGRYLTAGFTKSDNQSTPYTLQEGRTLYVSIETDLLHYLQHHNLIVFSFPFFEIVPSFAYCEYLVRFGNELFSKLYSDLIPGLTEM